MTKENLELAKYLEERIRNLQKDIDSIKTFNDLTDEWCLANFENHIQIYLIAKEKELILPPLLERKTEQLKLLQEEFERL